MEVRRLQKGDSPIGVQAIQQLKAPDGYPTPNTEYLERFLAKRERICRRDRRSPCRFRGWLHA
jgi:hypothetical protein